MLLNSCCGSPSVSRRFVADAVTDRKRDPTGTTPIVARFERDLLKRLKKVQSLVRHVLIDLDVLGTKPASSVASHLTSGLFNRTYSLPSQAFAFNSPADKIPNFMRWLEDTLKVELTGVTTSQDSWVRPYVEAVYLKGVRDATARAIKIKRLSVKDARLGFSSKDVVDLLSHRTFMHLLGVSSFMSATIATTLAEGVLYGLGSNEIVKKLTLRLATFSLVRARTLVRTELVRAYSEASLDTYRDAEIEGVEVEAELTTADDDAVCPQCHALEGKRFSLEEADGLIPLHPNCRCALLPVVIDPEIESRR